MGHHLVKHVPQACSFQRLSRLAIYAPRTSQVNIYFKEYMKQFRVQLKT
jgi:hypothetical protein